MALFDDSKFTDTLTQSYAAVSGQAVGAIPIDIIPVLIQAITGLFGNCFKTPSPTPATPEAIAAQIKGASSIQRGIIRGRIQGAMRDAGRSRREAANGALAAEHAVNVTSAADLAVAIDHAQKDATEIPAFNLD